MSYEKAIVTIALGSRYFNLWKTHCQANWQTYADKHGYDILCITEPLDQSPRAQSRSPSWQKCLILSQPFAEQYERIVWLDADILINTAEAPSIIDNVPPHQIGAVDGFSTPTRDLYQLAMRRAINFWRSQGAAVTAELAPKDYYARFGLPIHHQAVIQAGVLVLSADHRPILEKVYNTYEDKGGPEWHYEMRPLSFELLESGLVHWIDWRFNVIWMLYKALHYPFLLSMKPVVRRPWRGRNHIRRFFDLVDGRQLYQSAVTNAFQSSYFLHFASTPKDMSFVDLHSPPSQNAQLL